MSFRLFVPILCLLAMLAGLGLFISPLFVTGGLIGWREAVAAGGIEHFFASAASIILGIGLMIAAGMFAVLVGIVFAVQAGTQARSNRELREQLKTLSAANDTVRNGKSG